MRNLNKSFKIGESELIGMDKNYFEIPLFKNLSNGKTGFRVMVENNANI